MWCVDENEGKSALYKPLLPSVAALCREDKSWMFLVAVVYVAHTGTWGLKRTKIQLLAQSQDPICSLFGPSVPPVSLSIVI